MEQFKLFDEMEHLSLPEHLMDYLPGHRDGNDSVAWHSDKDTIVGQKTEIASVSFGQPRDFDFRNKDNHRQQYSLKLGNGSLLLMKGDLQKYWEHRIAKSAKTMKPRINLTFRKVMG